MSQIIHCKQEMKLRNKTLYCTICGHSVPVNKKSARQDKQDASSKNTSYQALKHFETIFKSMFVQQSIKCILELLYKDYDPKRYAQLIKLIHI